MYSTAPRCTGHRRRAGVKAPGTASCALGSRALAAETGPRGRHGCGARGQGFGYLPDMPWFAAYMVRVLHAGAAEQHRERCHGPQQPEVARAGRQHQPSRLGVRKHCAIQGSDWPSVHSATHPRAAARPTLATGGTCHNRGLPCRQQSYSPQPRGTAEAHIHGHPCTSSC